MSRPCLYEPKEECVENRPNCNRYFPQEPCHYCGETSDNMYYNAGHCFCENCLEKEALCEGDGYRIPDVIIDFLDMPLEPKVKKSFHEHLVQWFEVCKF